MMSFIGLKDDFLKLCTACIFGKALKQMTWVLRIPISVVSAILFLHMVCGDDIVNSTNIRWTCQCASDKSAVQSFPLGANCSTTSCDCKLADGYSEKSDGERWSCLCAAENLPASELSSNIHNNGCFTTCNCTSDASDIIESARKHITIKRSGVCLVLLVCVILTTLAFLASIGCYVFRKDRCPVQPPIFISDKETSWNSGTNLISHRSSMTEYLDNRNPFLNPILGFLHRVSFVFSGKRGSIPGSILYFSYYELEKSTNKFSEGNLIGLGGSSTVYHGNLKDGKDIAVKRLKKKGGPNLEFEFLTEIELLSRLHHCHIVPLLGFCLELQGKHMERLLVFEYMPNGNLRDNLSMTQVNHTLDWETRVRIALGAAKGLEYLHEAAAPRILHRDIKSTNILLDDKWRPRITDLGMAKCLMADDLPSCSSSPARMLGTFGYFAPEYANVGKASLKSDVFSFGVVLLELASGRLPINRSSNKSEESLVMWATPRLLDSKRVVSEIADPALKGNFPEEEMQVMAYLARECIQFDPECRPSMSEVVQILSTIAPEKSKRRNFPPSTFQSSLCQSIKQAEDMIEAPISLHKQPCDVKSSADIVFGDAVEWSRRSSLPLMVDKNLCSELPTEGDTVLSAEYMDRLVLLKSRAQSWRSPDDEIVDLTEPRLETFWQPNMQSL